MGGNGLKRCRKRANPLLLLGYAWQRLHTPQQPASRLATRGQCALVHITHFWHVLVSVC